MSNVVFSLRRVSFGTRRLSVEYHHSIVEQHRILWWFLRWDCEIYQFNITLIDIDANENKRLTWRQTDVEVLPLLWPVCPDWSEEDDEEDPTLPHWHWRSNCPEIFSVYKYIRCKTSRWELTRKLPWGGSFENTGTIVRTDACNIRLTRRGNVLKNTFQLIERRRALKERLSK